MINLLMPEQRRPVIFSAYAIVHTVTLMVITSVLLLNALPIPIVSALPQSLRQLRYTEDLERSMCREDGFGWDENWLDQCRSSITILSTGAIWIGLVMMVAQWWALTEAWTWVALSYEVKETRERTANLESACYVDEKEGLKIIKEV